MPHPPLPWCSHGVRAGLAALLLASLPGASAFESTPPEKSVHDAITAEAAAPLGWEGLPLSVLQQAVRALDVAETKVKGSAGKVAVLDALGDYEPAHHCDRLPPTPDAEAFAVASAYVRLQRAEALQFARTGHPERTVSTLGRALHALQDCFSHSNVCDLGSAEQAAFQRALLAGGAPPEGVRLTGFQPGEEDASMPPGDDYPHGHYAKDAPDATPDAQELLLDGSTKFEAARALAVATSRMFLEEFLAQLNATEREAVVTAGPRQGQDLRVPAPLLPALLGLLAASAAWRHRSRASAPGR